MQQIPASLLTLVAGAFVTIVGIWVSQTHNLLPVQASEQAPLVDNFFNVMFAIAIALFLIVEGTILFFAIQFRQRKGDNTDGPPIEGNVPLEIFWTAIPTLIVFGLGIYSVDVYKQMGGFPSSSPAIVEADRHDHSGSVIAASISEAPTISADTAPGVTQKIGIKGSPAQQNKAADVTVDVTGMQFAWIFSYPQDNVTSGELHVPVGADVQLNIAATDVIHSFWVPQFRLKQDAIPGMATELRFVATKPGTYPVVCTELCGAYHGAMRSKVIVHTPDEYQSWLQENRIAQQESNGTVAVNPAELSSSEYLTPYSSDIGINSAVLAQIQK
ncbi:cytochrome c oxidase subunit II [Rivularia sp. UHCC 0363]|uniref:cytochrome c oxidase subunit II n=1 Tax=Rivularia sp. UHCC 0363 TaxID=3110244 RepID=UPI002B215AB4|nr:cytochrome c oxidase subunit II [Rivularia sp. UHCC 0363]MEA5593338.1 cytochrome c oxidase subunit II [Rivularia sp. UHCC 0363]